MCCMLNQGIGLVNDWTGKDKDNDKDQDKDKDKDLNLVLKESLRTHTGQGLTSLV